MLIKFCCIRAFCKAFPVLWDAALLHSTCEMSHCVSETHLVPHESLGDTEMRFLHQSPLSITCSSLTSLCKLGDQDGTIQLFCSLSADYSCGLECSNMSFCTGLSVDGLHR